MLHTGVRLLGMKFLTVVALGMAKEILSIPAVGGDSSGMAYSEACINMTIRSLQVVEKRHFACTLRTPNTHPA